MERPRLSICSSSDSCDDSVSSARVLDSPSTLPPVAVDNLVVHNGGTGVVHGNITSFTVNQYLVPDPDNWDPGVVRDLVVDAVKISSDTNNKFFPHDTLSSPQLPGKKEDLEGLQRKWCYLIGALVLMSFVTLLSSSVFSLTSIRSISSSQQTYPSAQPPEDNTSEYQDLPGAPRIMTRMAWVAQPPNGPLDNNTLPIQRVIVLHTATEGCDTTPECILRVRYIQQFHVESRKWSDIAYNFLVGGDGCVYEGRGFDKMGAHTKGYNNGTLGIAFIGTYTQKMPNTMQIEAFQKLVYIGVNTTKISENYKLLSQCQLQITAAPGLVLAQNMTSWSHYDSSLPIRCTAG